MRTILSTTALVVAAASQLGASDGGCGTPILADEGFDMWCGESLCAWQLITREGTIEKAATWHGGDAGVAFLGSEATIEQISSFSTSGPACLVFEMVANVPTDAEMFLDIDLFADGTSNHSLQIPTSDWKPVSLSILLRRPVQGIRFQLTKRGTGRAVLAQVHARNDVVREENGELVGGCEGFAPIDDEPSPLGAGCNQDSECASGICGAPERPEPFSSAKRCLGCDDAHPCSTGQICGLGEPMSPTLGLPQLCVAQAADEIGDRCLTGAECDTGLCGISGTCSTCTSGTNCASGVCAMSYIDGPFICQSAPSGAPCARHDDCASYRCEGNWRYQCQNGMPCTVDDDCGFVDGEHRTCDIVGSVGITGGTCF